MRKTMLLVLFMVIFFFTGCSSDESTESANVGSQEDSISQEQVTNTEEMNIEKGEHSVPQSEESNASERMVMYHANLTLEVKNIKEMQDTITKKTIENNGYVVESSMTSHDTYVRSHLKVRIPNTVLQNFLQELELKSKKVLERQVTGEDVTEEYTDLESRLQAKQKVESRLLEFMQNAEETEDLLRISNDLANVQEEIEQIEGRKQYLENRTDFAEVNVVLKDVSVEVPNIAEEDLQTGEKIKQAFVNSLNTLSKFFSGLIVFFIGYSPFLIIIAILACFFWYLRKRGKNKE